MSSQALGSAAETASPTAASTPVRGRGRRPRPLVAAALFAGAWLLPVLTQLTGTDPLIVAVVVIGTGGLLRVGSTVVDRLMLTLALLIGLAIAGGLLFSVWPWGLQPVALGGLALTLLVAAHLWLGAPPPWRTWPRRMLGSDVVLLLGVVAGTLVAYWPSFGLGTTGVALGNRLGFAGITGDRLRHYNLFDTIHRLGGYTFLMQGKAKSAVDPGMLSTYPSGQHYVYALADIFLRSNVDPGNPVSEMNRYNLWVSLGYGFFVASVAWAARWAAGPALAGWRRAFLTTAIAAFLSVGAFTSAIWCTWDPQVFCWALLAMLAAVCLRPPTGVRTHVALMALLTIGVCLTYELFAPFAAILVVVSVAVYRKRLLPHWKLLIVTAVVSAPMALSEYMAARSAGFSGGSAVQAIGFTIPLSWLVLTVLGALSVLGFASRAARRSPAAVAGLASVLIGGLAVLALMADQEATIHAVSYYFQKFVQAWAVIMMIAAGSFGHLLRRPVLPRRGLAGLAVGVCSFVLAVGATHSFWWTASLSTRPVPATDPNPGASWSVSASSSWASIWMSRRHIVPGDITPLERLNRQHMLGDGVPTVAVIFPNDPLDNINLSLQLAALNRDAGTMAAVINGGPADGARGLNSSGGLVCAGQGGAPWTAQQRHDLTEFEAGLTAVGRPVRVVVNSPALAAALGGWAATHPSAISRVIDEPTIGGGPLTC